MLKKIRNNLIIIFVARFFVLFIFLYGLNYALIGLAIPGGYYNDWVAHHLNYAPAFRSVLLAGASLVVKGAGFSYYTDAESLHLPGAAVHVAYTCLGFGLMCFHWAFVMAYPLAFKRKLFFLLAGTVTIILLNILRIGGLAMIYSVTKFDLRKIDHHAVFNFIVYVFLFLLIRQMINERKPVLPGSGKS